VSAGSILPGLPLHQRPARSPLERGRAVGVALVRHPVSIHLTILTGFLLAGIAVTWPRAADLSGQMPATRDAGSYIWGFWWVAHQLEHLSNPWFSHYIAAPVGASLGLHALLPLPDVLMLPVTVAFGPAIAYNLLSIAIPGLSSYAMYRVGRLWLPSQAGAIAAGACFGLSSLLTWRAWYHLNLAAGALLLPVALEVTVRLTRRPCRRQAVIAGLVVGGAVLTDQEMSVLVISLTALALLPWLLGRPVVAKLRLLALVAIVAGLLASPQIIAIASQMRSGGASSPAYALGTNYVETGVKLNSMFALSPRVRDFGLGGFGIVYRGAMGDGIPTYGLVLSVLALVGLLMCRRRRSARLLALLWFGSSALALGPVLKIAAHRFVPLAETLDGHRVSAIMPYTWFVQLPGMSGFREASRMMMLGILPTALLAGAGVERLRKRAAPAVVVVAALAALEFGWSGNRAIGTLPTALPAVDRPIAADHSKSIVVDVPYGIRGGTNFTGGSFDPDAQVLATVDGHPRAVGYISRVPAPTLAGLEKDAFYVRLMAAQRGYLSTPTELAVARQNARRLNIGWVLLWRWPGGHSATVTRYVRATGFRLDYSADGVWVYRATV